VADAPQFYYLDGARSQQGPVAVAEIERLARSGAIRRDTLVWCAGMPDWRPASQVNGLASLFAQAAPPPPRPSAPPSPAFPAAPSMQRTVPNAGIYPGQAPQAQARGYEPAKRMGFGQAIATCLRKYVDFTGRAGRPEYWFFMLFYYLLLIVLIVIDVIIFAPQTGGLVLTWLGVLALFLPTLSAGVRRLHDQDHSGWMLLLGLIPFGGIIVLVFMCLPGTHGPNRFGPVPGSVDPAAEFD
jgi:uncharacterized membrane protein YhaH (DUF805 family)